MSAIVRSEFQTISAGDLSVFRAAPEAADLDDDVALVNRARSGDSRALAMLVERYYQRALRVAATMIRDPDEAQDVVQEAFARVQRRIATFQGSSSFFTWLYRVVVNACIDHLRRRARQQKRQVDVDTIDNFADDHQLDGPEQAAKRADIRKRLAKALSGIPEIHRAVIILRDVEGLSYEEIASTLRIKKGTVMSRLFHARKKLQSALAQEA